MNVPPRAMLSWVLAVMSVLAAFASAGAAPPGATLESAASLPPAPSVSAAAAMPEPLHAWVIVPKADRKESVIFHVPPRTGETGARLGVAYIAERLVGVPARVTGWGTRVYLVTDPETVAESRYRRVYTINARYEGAWGWSYQPEERLGVLPSLPAEGELVSLVADGEGVSALLWTSTAPNKGTWSALRLDGVTGEAWVTMSLPWDAVDGGVESPLRGGAALVVLDGTTMVLALRPRGPAATGLEGWTREGDRWTRTIGPNAQPLGWTPDGDALVGLDGRIVEVVADGVGVAVHSLWPLARRDIARVSTEPDQPGAALGVGALDRGVLVAMWRGAADAGGRRGDRATEPPMSLPGAGVVAARAETARFKIAEVSTRTGRTLAAGAVRQPTPLADRPLHLIALLTAAFMAGLLLYTLRRGDPKVLPVPFQPGGLMRRATATVLDFAVGLGLAGVLWRAAPADLLTVQTLLGSVSDAAPIWAALALSAMHSTVAELALGGSVGKVAMGCRVGVYVPGSGDEAGRVRRASPQAVIIRNLTKWALLPSAAIAVFDPLHRHAADVVAGTVVIDLPDEPSAPAAPRG